jgi:hypothetical protein
MNNLGNFLSKFNLLDSRRKKIKEAVISCFKEELNLELSDKDIKVVGNKIELKSNQLLKTEIFIRQKEFLSRVNSKIKPEIISEIK